MRCIICGGTSFSIRLSDLDKSREEQIKNSKYGDCCSLSCAFKKSQRLVVNNGYTKEIYKVSPTKTYVVQVPNYSHSVQKEILNKSEQVEKATETLAEAV